MKPWIFTFKQEGTGMWHTYETDAETKESAILKISEMLRSDGHQIPMEELLYTVHEHVDNEING